MVDIKEAETGNIIEITLTGKLTRDAYETFVPQIEQQLRENGKLRMLVLLQDFHGWTAGALWEDIKFDAKHFSNIERLALVGETKWEKGMATFCKPFTMAKVRYFDSSEIESARQWLSESAS